MGNCSQRLAKINAASKLRRGGWVEIGVFMFLFTRLRVDKRVSGCRKHIIRQPENPYSRFQAAYTVAKIEQRYLLIFNFCHNAVVCFLASSDICGITKPSAISCAVGKMERVSTSFLSIFSRAGRLAGAKVTAAPFLAATSGSSV